MRAAAFLASIVWAAIAVPASVTLLCVAATNIGRLWALAVFGLSFAAILLSRAALYHRRNLQRAGLLVGAGCLIVAAVLGGVQLQRPVPAGPLHVVPKPAAGLTRLVPEVDQLMLMFAAAQMGDPLFTARQGEQLRGWTRTLYQEMDSDPSFSCTDTFLADTYVGLLTGRAPRNRGYVYVPPTLDTSRPAPTIVFFHGSGGNFRAYVWILKALADRQGSVLLAPSGGLGAWNDPEQSLLTFLDSADAIVRIDRSRLHAVGLSNGGRAVSQLLASRAVTWKSAVFLSPVFDALALELAASDGRLRSVPVLVVAGQRDERVPPEYVKQHEAALRAAGAKVGAHYLPSADHFVLFSDRAAVVGLIDRWWAGDRNPGYTLQSLRRP